MKMNEYQKLAYKTANPMTENDLLVVACLGLAGEGGEFIDEVKKFKYQGHDLDKKKLVEELGDIMWYLALGCTALGVSMDDMAEINLLKLAKRYDGSFGSQKSRERIDAD